MPELIHLDTRKPITRILAILFLIVAVIWSYFALRWYIGNTLAENLSSSPNELEVARLASSMSPGDPLTHWRVGLVTQTRLPVDQIGQAVAEFEQAVSLSPNDYRFWTALGTAYEQAGETKKSEDAFRRALNLAPAYAQPHWYLGNLLLRNGRYQEAFTELRMAGEANDELRPQFFNLLWQIYSGDPQSLQTALGTRADTRAAFAQYLATQKQYPDASRIWASLSAAEKRENKDIGNAIVTALVADLRFYDALTVWNDLATSAATRAQVDRMLDGSFEEVGSYGPEMVFGWQVKNVPQMQIGIDPSTAHSGSRSLRLVFQVRGKLEPLSVSQVVPISPDKQYEFEFYQKTDKLESGATPSLVVTSADGTVLAASGGAPNGDTDWQRVSLLLKTPPKSEAVVVRIVRGTCDNAPVCPIFGTVWYDDFSFKRRD